jgi:hypothetical protein
VSVLMTEILYTTVHRCKENMIFDRFFVLSFQEILAVGTSSWYDLSTKHKSKKGGKIHIQLQLRYNKVCTCTFIHLTRFNIYSVSSASSLGLPSQLLNCINCFGQSRSNGIRDMCHCLYTSTVSRQRIYQWKYIICVM